MADLQKFFKRNKIEIEKVLYIYHRDRKTIVCQEPGGEVFTSAPLQEVLAFLPEEDFISISRNAIVRRDKIINISHDGVYTMLDGKTFQGRTRYLSTHRRLKKDEVFKNGDRKWLVSYADVALNGSKRTLSDYSPEIDKNLTIHCYQPGPGYCACRLAPELST